MITIQIFKTSPHTFNVRFLYSWSLFSDEQTRNFYSALLDNPMLANEFDKLIIPHNQYPNLTVKRAMLESINTNDVYQIDFGKDLELSYDCHDKPLYLCKEEAVSIITNSFKKYNVPYTLQEDLNLEFNPRPGF